jgi:hypothetical protein
LEGAKLEDIISTGEGTAKLEDIKVISSSMAPQILQIDTQSGESSNRALLPAQTQA